MAENIEQNRFGGQRSQNQGKMKMMNKTQGGTYGNRPTGLDRPVSNPVLEIDNLYVTHVGGPCLFWAQTISDEKTGHLTQLAEDLFQICNNAPGVTTKPDNEKQIFGAKFSEDGLWYRCRVKSEVSDTEVDVQFIDYGNGEVKKLNELVELPATLMNIKPHAQIYVLYGLRPLYNEGSQGFSQGIEFLKGLTMEKMLSAKVYGTGPKVIPVVLEDKDNDADINQLVLDAGFANRRFQGQQGQRPQGQGQQQGQRQGQQQQQQGQIYPKGQFDNARRPLQGQQQQGILPVPMNSVAQQQWINMHQNAPPPNFNKTDPGMAPINTPPPNFNIQQNQQQRLGNFPQHLAGPRGQEQRNFKIESSPPSSGQCNAAPGHASGDNTPFSVSVWSNVQANDFHEQNDRGDYPHERLREIEEESNQKTIEIAKLRGRLKHLEEENENLKATIKKTTFSNKMNNLLAGVSKVKSLRLQFPTDLENEVRNNVDHSISLLESDRIQAAGIPAIENVIQSKTDYETAQDSIKNISDQSNLQELISSRDEARKELDRSIDSFLAISSALPLEKRHSDLQDALSALNDTHGAFISDQIESSLQLEEAVTVYNEWHNEKKTHFQTARTSTNTCHNAVNSALRILQQQLSLESGDLLDNTHANAKMDDLLDKFQLCLDREITTTDIVNSPEEKAPDRSILSCVVQAVVKDIRTELDEVAYVLNLQNQYTQVKDSISRWLSEKADITKIKSTRASIKSLKSKLRHRLADKLDQEESEDNDESEMAAINADLTRIRSELHDVFIEEDQLLAELGELSTQHFPELVHKNSDLGISDVVKYMGLVKLGRSLDQYDAQPIPSANSVLYKSTFADRPVILKEVIIDESLSMSKEVFLEKIITCSKAKHSQLLSPQFVFFSKRHCYVQIPYMSQTLTSFMKQCQPTAIQTHNIIKGILEAVGALHSNNLVHGAVHPGNIFVGEDGKGVLSDIDCSRTLAQRMERCYKSEDGQEFRVPEGHREPDAANMSADLYQLGLVFLTLIQTRISPEGAATSLEPSAILQSLDAQTKTILASLLSNDPSQRGDVQTYLQLPYFINEPREKEEEAPTLQLRSKSPPIPRDPERTGILKNSPSSTPPMSPPILDQEEPVLPSTGDITATPTNDVTNYELVDENGRDTPPLLDPEETPLPESTDLNDAGDVDAEGDPIAVEGDPISVEGDPIPVEGEISTAADEQTFEEQVLAEENDAGDDDVAKTVMDAQIMTMDEVKKMVEEVSLGD